jgi:hypothetical protein
VKNHLEKYLEHLGTSTDDPSSNQFDSYMQSTNVENLDNREIMASAKTAKTTPFFQNNGGRIAKHYFYSQNTKD